MDPLYQYVIEFLVPFFFWLRASSTKVLENGYSHGRCTRKGRRDIGAEGGQTVNAGHFLFEVPATLAL
jgi:hypothetical protein